MFNKNNIDLDRIYTSTNYDEFKYIHGNRDIKSFKIQNIKIDFEKRGHISPIVVNQQKKIIDGQHRFECCKILGLPVRYIYHFCNDKDLLDTVSGMNTVHTSWNNLDWANRYVVGGDNKDDYKRYLEIHNLGVAHSLILEFAYFLNSKHSEEEYKNIYHYFKLGKFDYPQIAYEKTKSFVKIFEEYLPSDLWKKVMFIRVLLKLRNKSDVNFDIHVFAEKFKRFPQKWTPANTRDEFLKSIINVYNYRAKQSDKIKVFLE